jgi:hypothetical protein
MSQGAHLKAEFMSTILHKAKWKQDIQQVILNIPHEVLQYSEVC